MNSFSQKSKTVRHTFFAVFSTLALLFAGGEFDSVVAQDNVRFQFDDTVYELPPGWRKGKTFNDHVAIYNKDEGVRSIEIFRSEKIPDSVNSWIESKMKSILDGDKITKVIEARSVRKGKQRGVISGCLAKRKLLLGFAAIGKRNANLVVMQTRIPRNENADKAMARQLKDEFLPFILELKYISQGAKPVLGSPVVGKLSGTFTGLKYSYGIDLTTNLDQEFYTFSKSGRFIRGLPQGMGIQNVDFEKAIRKFPDDAGNYRLKREKIYFEFADGVKKSRKFEKTKTGFKMEQTYSLVKMLADGVELEGLFSDINYSSFTQGSNIEGGVVQSRSFRFTKSGEFTATKFSGSFGNFENGVGSTTGSFSTKNKSPKIAGRYQVKDGAIKLIDESGKVAVCGIVQLGDRLLFIDGVRYLKAKPKKKN